MLTEQDLTRLLEDARFEQLKKDDYLFRQGETKSQNIYLIAGRVSLLADGKEVDTVVAGTDTARFPLAHQIPRKNSARALGRVECIRIDTHKLGDLLANNGKDSGQADDPDSADADDWMTQLLQSKVFQQIPASNIQSVMMRMEETQVSAGDEVIRQGDDGDYFYLIHRGRCSVTKVQDKAEGPVELAQLGPGDSFGEEALLSDSPRGSSVTMLSDGVLLRLSKEDFIEFVKRPLAQSISYEEGLSRVERGAVWLDVRSSEEYERSHIKGSVNLPVHLVRYQASTLAPDRHYIAYCETGQQSATAAFLLIEMGFEISVLGEGGFDSVPKEGLTHASQSEDERAKVISLESGEELSSGEKAGAAGVTLKALEEKLRQLQEDKKRTTVQWLAERKTLKLAIAKAQVRLTALEKERDSANAATHQVEEKLALSTKQRDSLRHELEALQAKMASSSAGEQESEEQIQQLLQKQAATVQERDAALSELQELKAVVAAGSVDEKKAEGQILQLQDQLATITQERDNERSKLGRLQSEMAASHAIEKDAEEQIQQLQDELAKIAQEKAEERSRLEHLQAEMAASSAGEREVEGQLKQLLQKQAAIAQERDAALGELEGLKAKIAANSAGEKGLEIRMRQLQEELAVTAKERDEERSKLGRLQSEMAAASSAADKESEERLQQLQQVMATIAKDRDEARVNLERLQAEMKASSAEPKGSGKLAKKLQAEQEIMSKELERVRGEAKQRDAEDKAKIEYLTEELNGLRTQLIQLSTIEKESASDSNEEELHTLRTELEFVRSQNDEELQALRTELEFVRSQAAADMGELQKRLAEAEAEANVAKGTEQEGAQEDIKHLKKSIKQRQKQVEKANAERHKLEGRLEERDAKIKQLRQDLEDAQVEAEEAGYGRKEAEEARTQVEAVLYKLKQEVEEEGAARERIDAHFKHSGKALDLSEITGKRISIKSILLGVLVGVGLLFVLLEGFMVLSGRGELITALSGSSQLMISQGGARAKVFDINRKDQPGTADSTRSTDSNDLEQPAEVKSGVETGTVLQGADIGPVMLMIAGGEFTMGSDRNQISADERPAHKVVLQDFAISRNEVTFEEYDRFAQATGRPLPDDNGWGRGRRPVINVTWADASAYARWLAARTGKKYRLPSEAEWEFAASGGSDSIYWWGYEIEKGRANCFDCGSGWDQKSTAPVGRFGPNGFGVHDTAGNVREWVRDCYHGSYEGAPTDGSAWEESGCKERVVRGGAYDKPAESMRSTWRGHLKPDTSLPMLGFRLVQEL